MNTLNLIRNQIEKAARLHDAQIAMTSYRGVKYECKQNGDEYMVLSAIVVTHTISDRHARITSRWDRIPRVSSNSFTVVL